MGYANVFRPMGFWFNRPAGKAADNVKTRPVVAVRQASGGGNASFDIAIGDAYALDINGNAFRAGPNDTVRGIVIGLRFLPSSLVMGGQGPVSNDYLVNGSTGNILGVEDDTTIFQVQGDTYATADDGMLVNLVDAAPDSTLSQSRQSVTLATVGQQFQLLGLQTSLAMNAVGTNAVVLVRMVQTFGS